MSRLDLEELSRILKEDDNNYFKNLAKKFELDVKRFKKFENYLVNHSFRALMDRIISEHNDEYFNKCYEKGYEPYPNNKLNFIIDYVTHNCAKIYHGRIDIGFPNDQWFFKGLYFQLIYGQGALLRIYDIELNLLFQI